MSLSINRTTIPTNRVALLPSEKAWAKFLEKKCPANVSRVTAYFFSTYTLLHKGLTTKSKKVKQIEQEESLKQITKSISNLFFATLYKIGHGNDKPLSKARMPFICDLTSAFKKIKSTITDPNPKAWINQNELDLAYLLENTAQMGKKALKPIDSNKEITKSSTKITNFIQLMAKKQTLFEIVPLNFMNQANEEQMLEDIKDYLTFTLPDRVIEKNYKNLTALIKKHKDDVNKNSEIEKVEQRLVDVIADIKSKHPETYIYNVVVKLLDAKPTVESLVKTLTKEYILFSNEIKVSMDQFINNSRKFINKNGKEKEQFQNYLKNNREFFEKNFIEKECSTFYKRMRTLSMCIDLISDISIANEIKNSAKKFKNLLSEKINERSKFLEKSIFTTQQELEKLGWEKVSYIVKDKLHTLTLRKNSQEEIEIRGKSLLTIEKNLKKFLEFVKSKNS